MVNEVSSMNSYGNIQRVGIRSNRVIYRVIDSKGKEAGMMTVDKKDADTFEKSYIDIMSTAPKIQKYVSEHSSPEELQRRRTMSRVCIGAGTVIGAILPPILMKKASVTKKILSSIGGIVLGLTAGFAASLSISTPPGALKFARASRTLSKIDIQPLQTENV